MCPSPASHHVNVPNYGLFPRMKTLTLVCYYQLNFPTNILFRSHIAFRGLVSLGSSGLSMSPVSQTV